MKAFMSRGYRVVSLFLALSTLCVIPSCEKKLKPIYIDPAFASHVISFSSGILSSSSHVQVRLVAEVPDAEPGKTLSFNPFSFSPDVSGKAKWVDKQTIEFIPEKPLQPGEIYTVDFRLDKFANVPDNLSTLTFRFQVKHQAIRYEFNGINPLREDDMHLQQVKGIFYTADYVEPKQFEKIISADNEGTRLRMRWKHSMDGCTHEFTLDSVERNATRQHIHIKWEGTEIGAKDDATEFVMPALNEFCVLKVRTVTSPRTLIEVFFSDPLSRLQDISGLITLSPGAGESCMVNGNKVTIIPQTMVTGEVKVQVYGTVKNIFEKSMGSSYITSVNFMSLKPQVELLGEGVIVPHTNGILFPFRAVSLSAVDVKIIRIFENNIVQFLQTNQLDGEQEIKRVGRVVYKGEVVLSSAQAIDYSQWNNFSLDLSKLIEPEPGAIYRVELSFRKKHSLYPMMGGKDEKTSYTEAADPNEKYNDPGDYWDYYEDESAYSDETYNWEEKDDPSKASYYMYGNHTVARNVLASDFGIIAKAGTNNEYVVALTDLRTTDPLKGVEIEFRNLQNQPMGSTTTDAEGMCRLRLADKPFVLIAKKEKQRGYLRLDDASSLSLSMFDVKGEELKKGLKGFLYGERGVWRPGDLMYLTFILEDKNGTLPSNHPAVLELFNPSGQAVQRVVKTENVNGFYSFILKTPPSAPTGNWMAKVHIGGAVFARTLRVETVKPNRMKIDLRFPSNILHKGVTESGTLQVNWLYGAPAANAKVLIDASVAPAKTVFETCKGYCFDDPTKTFSSEDLQLFKGNVNAAGNAPVKCRFDLAGDAPGMVAIQMKTRAFEAGGEFSIDRSVFNYSPYKAYVGVKIPEGKGWNNALYSNEKNLIPIALVDENGKPMSGKVKIQIYTIYWRWWWDQSPEENMADFVSNQHASLMKTDYIDIHSTGRVLYEMNLGGEYWGRKLIKITDLKGGHSTGAVFYTTYRGWWSNAGSENPGGAEMLMFQTDKKAYKTGEKASLELPVTHQGRALISIETGSRILKSFWFVPTKSNARFEFEITPDMAPNIYVHVSYIQPHNHSKNDYPIRMYGVQPVSVEDPGTHLTPVITMKSELKPMEKFTVNVRESKGKPMTCTVAVVDEGLLDLTRFQTPDPWAGFYTHEALGVRTWDLYKYVAGAFTGKLSGLFAIGGDLYLNKNGRENNNRFKPVVLFQTPVSIGAGESKRLNFTLPNYVGSVRVMVVAGNKGAYGCAEKAVPVKQSLMVLATLPRVISPTETIKVPVTVFATDPSVKKVTVTLATDNRFDLPEENSRQVVFDRTGDKIVEFTVRARALIALGHLKIIARSGNRSATSETALQIRMPNPPVSKTLLATLKPGEKWTQTVSAFGVAGTNSGRIELSTYYPLNMEKRLNYLIQYPHGCIEQISSAAFPQLYLAQVTDLSALDKSCIETNIRSCLLHIKSYQQANGGFAYWPDYSKDVSEWGTNYAGHFMLEAQAHGYQLPVGLLDPWLSYQTRQANNWQFRTNDYGSDLTQAYRLYTLALAKKPALSAMNRMRETAGLNEIAKWRLAAAYAVAGKPDVADQIIRGLSLKPTKSVNYEDTYGSEFRDRAMMLETLTLLHQNAQAKVLAADMASVLASDSWLSTQSTAYMLLSLCKFIGTNHDGGKLDCDLSIDGKSLDVHTDKAFYRTAPDFNVHPVKSVVITNNSNRNMYVFIHWTGIPVMKQQVAHSQNVQLSVRYFNMNDNALNPQQLKQGTDFYAEVRVTHPGLRMNYTNMALQQLFPSGWEIMSSRLDAVKSSKLKSDAFRYQDIRDDRVSMYFDLNRGQTKTFRILLHAAYVGNYYLPSVQCDAMYDNSIAASTSGQWVKVTK